MPRIPGLLLAPLLAPLVVAGCVAPPPPSPCDNAVAINTAASLGIGQVPPGPPAPTLRQGVRIIDDGLMPALYVEEVMAGRGPTGAAQIGVRLINCASQPLQVEGAVQFLDAMGAPAEPPSVWKRVFLPPHTSRVFAESAVGPRAAGFILEIRGGQ